jgi:hypothetical protein
LGRIHIEELCLNLKRKLQSGELHDLYASSDIIKKDEMDGGHVTCIEEMRNAHKILAENVKGRDRFEY